MIRNGIVAAILLAAGASRLAAAPEPTPPAEVFFGATLHPVSRPPIADGVLVVVDGRIAALGGRDAVTIPAGARRIDLSGLDLYPSMIHPGAVLGLTEIESVRGTVDTTEIGDDNAGLRAEVAFNADSMLLPVTMSGGILLAHVVPDGGLFSGSSALMRLDGWNWQDMTVVAPVGMHLRYPRLTPAPGEKKEEFDKRKERELRVLDETIAAARAYGKAEAAAKARTAPAPEFDRDLSALQPVLAGSLPLFIHADGKADIESALDWARRQELHRIVLVAGPEVQRLAERLAREKVPVLLDGVLRLPPHRWEPYDFAYTAAAHLYAAGVSFAIGDGDGGFTAANSRNLPFHAAMAAAYGLPPAIALRSVTLSVAELLGVADRFGSLDPGKEATFIATTGDPLEATSRVERAWMAGREIDLSRDHQKRLDARYRDREIPAPER